MSQPENKPVDIQKMPDDLAAKLVNLDVFRGLSNAKVIYIEFHVDFRHGSFCVVQRKQNRNRRAWVSNELTQIIP